MFNANIQHPIAPLTITYVDRLTRVYNEPDFSLISLATAVIKPRVEKYEGIEGSYLFLPNASKVQEKLATFHEQRSSMNAEHKKNVPAFFYLLANYDQAKLEEIRTTAKNLGLTELTTIKSFVQQQLNITNYGTFINEENNEAFVVVDSTSMALYHLSISFISLLYPALFKNKKLNKEETEVLKGLTNKSATNFIERTSAILEYMKLDLLREELAACFKGFRQNRIDQCKREMDEANLRAESILEEYRRRVDTYNDLVIKYEGLMVVNGDDRNQEEQETIEYISSCPQIHNVQYMNGTLSFITNTLLTNFDMNKWRNAVRRNNIYDNYRLSEDSTFKDRTKRRMLFDAIFNSQPQLYVKTKGFIQLYISRCDMQAPRGQIDADAYTQLKNCLINPHFKIHGCPGRNKEQIIRCLRTGDIVSAIECAIAATGSVNIDETEYTFRPFLQEVLTSSNKILENNQGEAMTPEEAVLWLSKQEKVKEDDNISIPF